MVNIYDSPDYWCGEIGYRAPGYRDFCINTVKEIAILIHKPKSVLEIGCAYGYGVLRLNTVGVPTIGVDISRLAISRSPTKMIVCASVVNLPFADKQFDLGFSSGMLEHIPVSKRKQAIKEIIRVCARGLIGVASTDDAEAKTGHDDTHAELITLKEWQALFPAQFEVVRDSEVSWRISATNLVASGIENAS